MLAVDDGTTAEDPGIAPDEPGARRVPGTVCGLAAVDPSQVPIRTPNHGNAVHLGKGYWAADVRPHHRVATLGGTGTIASEYCVYHALSEIGCTILGDRHPAIRSGCHPRLRHALRR